jgi:hypothetical protein
VMPSAECGFQPVLSTGENKVKLKKSKLSISSHVI